MGECHGRTSAQTPTVTIFGKFSMESMVCCTKPNLKEKESRDE
jgi:hypothetical protein